MVHSDARDKDPIYPVRNAHETDRVHSKSARLVFNTTLRDMYSSTKLMNRVLYDSTSKGRTTLREDRDVQSFEKHLWLLLVHICTHARRDIHILVHYLLQEGRFMRPWGRGTAYSREARYIHPYSTLHIYAHAHITRLTHT